MVSKDSRLFGDASRGNRKKACMPKVKTHSRAKKTFKVTGSGKIAFRKPTRGHLLTKKSNKRKRALRVGGIVNPANLDFVKRLLRLK
jgi:large subunit ribosomal protein L35